ncbi:PDZ domain-containing protein [Algoriphagus sp. SE2]|uniref:S41 family peptidase n=1 Tax=Algoriphagus sp. SE2 TaxID=3141536 RepID=UPI0031CCF096
MKKLLLFFLFTSMIFPSFGQINAKLMRYMDVSDSQIAFVYGGDIWLVPKEGGLAVQLTNSPGEESWPRFSPDGAYIAFSASYNGNEDVYTMPVTGGVPTRVTYKSFPDRMIDWHPDGKRLLIASTGELGGRRLLNQFFLVDKDGGFPEKLPLPYGELGSFSPDGKQLAYITKITENYPFKRIRSGNNSDILIYDLASNQVENITNRIAIDGKPAWSGSTVYFLSDDNPEMRLNVWSYDTQSKSISQLTDFKDFDVSYLSASDKDLVFEMGGDLYLMDLAGKDYKKIDIQVVSDLSKEITQLRDVSKNIQNMTVSPDGKRVILEARGELFNTPAKEGFTINMTQSSGAFDHSPAWSPDRQNIAFWSDRSGEFEIHLQESQGSQESRKLTDRKSGFGYTLYWSPDSKKIAFLDEKYDISIVDVASGNIKKIGNTKWIVGHNGSPYYPINWSPDSKYLTFTIGQENANQAIFIYDTATEKLTQATSGFYEDSSPVFSKDGKYLFFQTNRNMESIYSDLGDGTWVYANTTQLAAVSLTKATASLISPKNDSLSISSDKKSEENKEEDVQVSIDFDGLESRIVLLPVKPGNFGKMEAIGGKLIYQRNPRTGSGASGSTLSFYDIQEREEKVILEKVNNYTVSADGKSILVFSNGQYAVIATNPGQKIEKPVPTGGLVMNWVAKDEWNQIFNDTWRRYRDFFYDPNMQGVDWEDMRKRYGALLKDARTRWDVSNIQSNMQAELAAGHTYTRGGDNESVTPILTGFLGIKWEKEGDRYKIGRIVRPSSWNTEVRSPFDRPGVEVKEGDFILAVNGIKLDPKKDPYAAFEGLSGKTVSLTIGQRNGTTEDSKNIVITCLTPNEERDLIYLEWVENNRKLVEKLSDGQLGYIYMSNTAGDGQRELISMYYGQLDKKGFIIDERFNGGGQLADRFLELLLRPVVYNLHWRNGRDHTNPIKANTGPMGMLINGWAGSGGDGLPWAFKVLNAGPIVGENTLGILVGPATGHQLIDGGGITVPDARLYDNAGHWFWEGEGVSPDIVVWDDPNLMMEGRDPQMERVVQEVLKLIPSQPSQMTPAPPYEDRTAKGLKNN